MRVKCYCAPAKRGRGRDTQIGKSRRTEGISTLKTTSGQRQRRPAGMRGGKGPAKEAIKRAGITERRRRPWRQRQKPRAQRGNNRNLGGVSPSGRIHNGRRGERRRERAGDHGQPVGAEISRVVYAWRAGFHIEIAALGNAPLRRSVTAK